MAVELAEGTLIAGRFRLTRCLGSGGMGTVWAARHEVTRRQHALKFVRAQLGSSQDLRARFLREARAAAAVEHPNVVRVHDVFEVEDGTLVMVMDLLEGETLGQRLARERPLPLPTAASVLAQVARAVAAAHARGVVHRDLKPDNVFLCAPSAEAPGGAVRVLDFGVAKLTEDIGGQTALTRSGAIVGTPSYMAPEQLFGEADVDHRADLWALGVMLYEMLAGMRPVEGDNLGQVVKRLTHDAITPIEALVDLPEDVRDLVSKLLSKDRTERPDGAERVAEVLGRHGAPDAGAVAEVLGRHAAPDAGVGAEVRAAPEGVAEVRAAPEGVVVAAPSSTPRAEPGELVSDVVVPMDRGGARIAVWGGVGLLAVLAIGAVTMRSTPGPAPEPVSTEPAAPVLDAPPARGHEPLPSAEAAAEAAPPAPQESAVAPRADETERPSRRREKPAPAVPLAVSAPPAPLAPPEPGSAAEPSQPPGDRKRGLVEDPPF